MLKLLMLKRDMLFVPDSEDIDVVVGRMGRLRGMPLQDAKLFFVCNRIIKTACYHIDMQERKLITYHLPM